MTRRVTIADVRRTHERIARLVVMKGGEVYLPLFERMEREIAAAEAREAALARARAVAAKQATKAW